jgi:hypothetical protein
MSIEPKLEKYILTIPELIVARKKFIRESKLDYTNSCIFADRQIIKIITAECAKTFGEKLSHGGETISCESVQTTIFCIYCFLCVPDFYISAICMSIRAGGDTDTTAAIVGGIVGARLGIESIPSYFVEKINDRGNYKSDELIKLSHKLYCQNFTNIDQLSTSVTLQTSIQPSAPVTTPSYTFGTTQETSRITPSYTFGTTQETSRITPSYTFGTTQENSRITPSYTFGTTQENSDISPSYKFGTTQENSDISPSYKFGTPQETTVTNQPYTFGNKQQYESPKITLSASMFVKPPPFLLGTTFGNK